MKLQLRFFIVLAAIFLGAAAFLLLQQKFEVDRSKKLLASELQQREDYLINIVMLDGRSEKTFVEDYSFWDDLVTFVKTDNVRFAHENLDTGLDTFATDADWVYRPSGTLVYFSDEDGSNALKQLQLPPAFFSQLARSKFAHFYIYDAGKLVEIRAATIVPSNDPNHDSAAKGFLLVGRVLNGDYTQSIAKLSGSTITLAQSGDTADKTTANTVSYGVKLNNWDGKTTAVLRSMSTVSLISNLREQHDRQLEILAVFTAVLVAIVIAMLWWLVLRPIHVIDRSIKSKQPALLERLKVQKTEFGRLARTVAEFFQQKVDLTESEFKRTELERLNKDKASFLAVAAHHLTGPVSNVKTFAEYLSYLLSNHAGEDEIKKQLNRISHQSIRMSMIVGDLQAAAASTGNQHMEFNLKDFDFDEFLLEEVAEAKFSTKNKLEAKSDTHARVHSDPDRVGQVVSNLIRNARKYSPDGGDIIVRGTLQGDKVVVSVHDSGIGISSEDQQHLFERFFRSAGVKDKYPGLGLDLYLSKNIIESLGGTIWVTSELGKGSIFYFSLPVKHEPASV